MVSSLLGVLPAKSRADWTCLSFDTADVKFPHLSVEIGPLDAESPCGLADAPAVQFEYRGDVLALEPGPGLPQRPPFREHHGSPVEPKMREHVIDPNAAAPVDRAGHAFEQRSQFHG